MADNPKWEDFFAAEQEERDRISEENLAGESSPAASSSPVASSDSPSASGSLGDDPVELPPVVPYSPPTRRQLRESEARTAAAEAADAAEAAEAAKARKPGRHPRSRKRDGVAGAASGGSDRGARPHPKRRGRFVVLAVLLVFLLVGAGAATAVWFTFEDQIRSVMGWELPNDFEGTGNGEPVVVTVVSGEIGSDIANTLQSEGVTMSYDAFYDLLIAQTAPPVFQPGSFQLEKEMSAKSALAALLDPANIVTSRVVIPEGSTITQTLSRLSEGTGVPLADFEAVAADYTSLGVPAAAPSLEGFLFPATYDFEPGTTAVQMLQTMADRMTQSLDSAGVAPDDRLRVLTMAALVQKEGGSIEDFGKVARVFQNRLDQGMNLQSDATVSYGSGGTSIHTTDAERADASNLYNTYANPGLPVGPISAPGDDAIAAVISPPAGDWLFFVLVNGETGETKFSNTFAEHEVAVAEWQDWYNAHPGWDN